VTFHNTERLDAVAEFNRYRLRKIVIVDPSIASLRIDGKFRSSNADAFLWLLRRHRTVFMVAEACEMRLGAGIAF